MYGLTFTDPVETGHEVLITDDGQPNEREHCYQDVDDKTAVFAR